MKRFCLFGFIIFSIFITSNAAFPYDFTKGDLAYRINEDGVSVGVCPMRVYTYLDLSDWYFWPEGTPPPYTLSGEVVIPESVNYEGITYPVTFIYNYCFCTCVNITSVIIPESVTEIGLAAFEACYGLINVSLPSNLKIIYSDCFCNCKNLKSITLPKSLYLIESGVFMGCSGLKNIYCEIKSPENIIYPSNSYKIFYWEDPSTFPFSTCVLHVPKGLKEVYQNTEPWNLFENIVDDIDDTVSGDINGDNIVDVEDVNAAINIILKLNTINDYNGSADVNGDDIVDVEDVNAIINIILKL